MAITERHWATVANELVRVTGQLAALRQANATLVEKWRKQARSRSMAIAAKVVYAHTANALEAATKEATA